MPKYVLSTATCSQRFVDYASSPNGGVNTELSAVLIRGGANLPSLTSGFGDLSQMEEGQPIWTPQGVCTTITDVQAEFLATHDGFQLSVKKGFYTILDSNPGDSHAKIKKLVGNELEARDNSAPLTTETLKTSVKITTKLLDEE